MKNTFYKIFPIALTGIISLCGCSVHTSKADTKENIVGLYELKTYLAKRESSDEEPYDRKAEEGIIAYFTIDMNGYGYYGYKDNDTPARVDSVFSTFIHDTDNPELYDSIELKGTNQTVYAWEKKVGCLAEPPMGFKRDKNESTLSYTIPWFEYTIYKPAKIQKYQNVVYKKVSGETGYEAINRLLGTSFIPDKPYEMKYMIPGYYVYRCDAKEESGIGPKNIYDYAILDMSHFENNKLNIIYSETANPEQKTVSVDVSVKEIGKSVSFSFNDKEFISSASSFATEFNEENDIKSESFSYYYSGEMTLDEVIALEIA